MPGTVERAEIGLLPHQLRLLLAQVQDQGRACHVGHGVERLAAAAHLAHQPELRLPLGKIGASRDQLPVQVRQLLVVQHHALARDQVVLGLVLGDGLISLANLLAERLQPLLQPAGSPVGRDQLRVELVGHVHLGDAVGDQRCLLAILRGVGDADQVGVRILDDGELAGEDVEGRLAPEPRRIDLEHRPCLLRQSGSDQPLVRQEAHQAAERVGEGRQHVAALLALIGPQGDIELRIVEEVQVVHNPRQEGARADQADLGGERAAVAGRQAAHDRLDIDHPRLARVEHHARAGGVGRRHLQADRRCDRRADEADGDDEPLSPSQDAEDAQKIDRVVITEKAIRVAADNLLLATRFPHRSDLLAAPRLHPPVPARPAALGSKIQQHRTFGN